jgi:predicted GNAT family acetyltransferase
MGHEVRHDAARGRYEILVDGQVAGVADYWVDGDRVVFPHTEVHPSHRGKGLAAELVRAALDDVRDQGRTVVPQCWYVARFLDDHPDYAELRAGS